MSDGVAAPRLTLRSTPICGADTLVRGEDDHRLCICDRASGHTDSHQDTIEGVIWTDAEHA